MNVSCAWVVEFHRDWRRIFRWIGFATHLGKHTQVAKRLGEDKLVNDFLKIQDPPKTSMETGNGPLQKEIPYLETIIFRFHVSFGGSMYFMTLFHAFHAPMLTCEADQIQRFHAKKRFGRQHL